MSEIKKSKKTRTGSVVSNRMEKSVVVRVERKVRHKLYGKYMKKMKDSVFYYIPKQIYAS